jgi:hypothetical protein
MSPAQRSFRRLQWMMLVWLWLGFIALILVVALPAWIAVGLLDQFLIGLAVLGSIAAGGQVIGTRQRAVMVQLPIRDAEAPYSHRFPTLTLAERERYEQTRVRFAESTPKLLGLVPFILLGVFVLMVQQLSGALLAPLLLGLAGFAIAAAERLIVRGHRHATGSTERAHDAPARLPASTRAILGVCRGMLIVLGLVCLATLAAAPVDGIALAAGGIAGWCTIQWGAFRQPSRVATES